MLLGNGCLYKTKDKKNQNACMILVHSIRQKDYFLYKTELLKKLTSVNIKEFPADESIKRKYPILRCDTKAHPWYTSLYNRLYINGRKEVNSFVMKHLNDLGLALWFWDSGITVINKSTVQGKMRTDSFSEAENYFIKTWLKKRFDLDVGITKHMVNKSRPKRYYRLYLPQKTMEKIFKIGASYKIPVVNKIYSDERLFQVYKNNLKDEDMISSV